MTRFLLALTVAVGTSAFAGQIQIGGSNGLTASYIGTGAGSFSEMAYNPTSGGGLWSGSTITNITAQTGGTLASNKVPNGNGGGATLTDPNSNIVFNLINDGTSLAPLNDWSGGGSTAMVIPIGVLDVSQAWTMLDNRWGPNNTNSTEVEFDFGTSATGGITESVIYQLTTGGQIASATACTAKGTGATANCTTFGTSAATTTGLSVTESGAVNSSATGTVDADEIFSGSYSGGINPYLGTSGTVQLYDQGFDFTTLSNYSTLGLSGLYLVDTKITDENFAAATNAGASRTDLSAITVLSLATPEPSTVLLMLTGLGALGFRLRRKIS